MQSLAEATESMDVPVPVIVNASAHSDGAAQVAADLGRFFEAVGIPIEIKLAETGGDIGEEVRRAIPAQAENDRRRGGDGTLNAAATLLVEGGIALGIRHWERSTTLPRIFMFRSISKKR
jgi:diacylglycerol kinase family enzyme